MQEGKFESTHMARSHVEDRMLNQLHASTRLSMNGHLLVISIFVPFALRLSKVEHGEFFNSLEEIRHNDLTALNSDLVEM